jgi:hypothetical protein
MQRTAYALLVFNDKTREILGWSVYSSDEGSITCGNGRRYARLAKASGKDYEEARGRAESIVKAWCPGLGDPS